MTRDRSFDQRITDWLIAEAPEQLPDRVLLATYERTRPARQRRGISGWRFPIVNRNPQAWLAVGATAIVLVLAGVVFIPRLGSSIGGPPATPTVGPLPTATAGPTSAASFAPSTQVPASLTGQIAFYRVGADNNADLWMMNLDRTGLVRLTSDPAFDWQPAFTPDGKTLVFSRRVAAVPESADIWSLDIESGVETQLTSLAGVEGDPFISPDGSQVAYDQWPDETGIHVMNIDGTDPRLVRAGTSDQDTLAGWTADGTALYLVRAGEDIDTIDVATGTVTPFITGQLDHAEPRLSPDGTRFVFQSDRNPPGIYVMAADGSEARYVTGNWTKVDGPGAWSPDGAWLVIVDPDGNLLLVRPDGTELTDWTKGNWPAWRPMSN